MLITPAPTPGESWTKENKGHTFHWWKLHKYWTATHNLTNCKMQHDTPTNNTESTKSSDKNHSRSIWHLLKVIT